MPGPVPSQTDVILSNTSECLETIRSHRAHPAFFAIHPDEDRAFQEITLAVHNLCQRRASPGQDETVEFGIAIRLHHRASALLGRLAVFSAYEWLHRTDDFESGTTS